MDMMFRLGATAIVFVLYVSVIIATEPPADTGFWVLVRFLAIFVYTLYLFVVWTDPMTDLLRRIIGFFVRLVSKGE